MNRAVLCMLLLCRLNVLPHLFTKIIPAAQGIDLVIKSVEAMVQPVENLEFTLFEKSNAPHWQAIKTQFMSSNESIKESTRELIDVSFRSVLLLNSMPCQVCNRNAQRKLIYDG